MLGSRSSQCADTSEPSRSTEPVADVAVGVTSSGKGSRAAESNARMEGLQAKGTDLYTRARTEPANTEGVNVVVEDMTLVGDTNGDS